MKIDLKKLETAFPGWSASKFSFSIYCELFIPAFYTFLKYGSLSLAFRK